MTINERMFEVMKKNNVKSIDVADYLRVTKSVISNWKNRGTDPPASYIEPICELLGISIEYLLTGKEDSSTNCTHENITENEKELLESFRILPEREQIKLIGIVEEKAKPYKENQGKSSDFKTG